MRVGAALVVIAAACRPTAPALDSCADDLGGVWRVDGATTPSGEPRRYHVIDLGRAIELYPMFDDSVLSPADRKETTADAAIVAPAAFDLARSSGGAFLVGTQTRRFMRGAASCVEHGPARLHDCAGDRATLDQAALAPPTDWDRCTPAPAIPDPWVLHRERD
jgi:hypothetical protein